VTRSQKRLLGLLLAIPVLLLVSTAGYMLGMSALEGQPRGFWDAFAWAGETLTTTGYGFDTHWRNPAMVIFVVLIQFIGVFLVFLIFPVYLIPFLEERFEVRLPVAAPNLTGHVLIYRYGPAVASLVPQAEAAGLQAVVLEPDEAVARRLFERGQRVVLGRLEDGGLDAAGLARARALIANGGDDENAAVILAARQSGFAGDVLALVEEPFHRKPMMLAGATAVYTPRHILGAALAARASTRISPRVAGVRQLGRKLEVSEVRVEPGSEVAGQTLEEAAVGARTGATVIAQWVSGRLETPHGAGMRLQPGGIAVVVGSREAVERLAGLLGSAAAFRGRGGFVVGGYGEVGGKVVELLRDAGEQVLVIDRQERPGVDLAGNLLDQKVLEQAGVREAQAVVLALDTDSATLFATVIVKDLAPTVPVIARVNRAENVERIHRAGADFALSISQVSGQMLARRLLGEEAVAIDPQLKLKRVSAEGLAGRHPAELQIRERTGCSVVAVERGDDVVVEFGADFRFDAGDAVYVCGDTEAVGKFKEVLASA
jgi:Trk K+ transport system NAD-binding subunit